MDYSHPFSHRHLLLLLLLWWSLVSVSTLTISLSSFLFVNAGWVFSFVSSLLFLGCSSLSPKFAFSVSLKSRSLISIISNSMWEMQGMGHWVTDSFSSFAKNHHESLSLKHLTSLREKQSYQGISLISFTILILIFLSNSRKLMLCFFLYVVTCYNL